MKRMIVTIIILFIIFISMVISRNVAKSEEIRVDEVNTIEEYMKKIYGWKEVTNEALPEFADINNANEKWVWGTLRENIDEYEIEYETINSELKKLFGDSLKKEYPKAGTEFILFDQESQKYIIQEIRLDAVKDSYLLNKIEKNEDGYIVEIIEYLIDYKEAENGKVVIKNLKDEAIYELKEEMATDGNIKKIVKDNIDKFTKKKVTLIKQEENVVVKKVEKIHN